MDSNYGISGTWRIDSATKASGFAMKALTNSSIWLEDSETNSEFNWGQHILDNADSAKCYIELTYLASN